MQRFLKTSLRNILLITVGIIVVIALLKNSQGARSVLIPSGVPPPPGIAVTEK